MPVLIGISSWEYRKLLENTVESDRRQNTWIFLNQLDAEEFLNEEAKLGMELNYFSEGGLLQVINSLLVFKLVSKKTLHELIKVEGEPNIDR